MTYEKVCRVCLTECADITPLWVQLPGENKTLKEAIDFVANINIKLEDGLPDKICKTCESVLDLADTFKQRCLESESILERQAQENLNDESRPKYEKHHQETYSKNSLGELTESAENIYDLPKHKIKIEIEETEIEQKNLHTPEYEVPIEHCFIKQEFSAETMKCFDNTETFCCPHCSLTFQTKLSYKVHIIYTHSSFIHRTDAPSLEKPKLEAWATAEVRSATEGPAAADTSTAMIISSDHALERAKKSHVIKKINKDKMKKKSTKGTAAVLKLPGTKTDDNISCATDKQSKCSNNTVIGTPGDIPTCDICGYTTATVKNLNSHLKAHAATKRYSCDSCLYLSVELSHFKNHIRTHSTDKPYSCDECDKKFSDKRYLDRHLGTHTGVRPYSCDVCGKRFTHKHHIDGHLRTHTGEKPYYCDVCQKQFSLKSSLDEHLRTHTDEMPYSCDVCGKRFRHKSTLVTHARTHTGDKPYSCDVCEKRFSVSYNLIRHLRTHSGEKPYSCDVCAKSFVSKKGVLEHKRTHTGERPYSCDMCGKKFRLKSSLDEHMRTHTGEKPYSCDVCDKRFRHKSTLLTHARTHTGDKPYSCDMCKKKFRRRQHLSEHLKTHR